MLIDAAVAGGPSPSASPSRAVRDPSDCKRCPDWDDAAGRCRLAVRERFQTCGSEAVRFAARGRRTRFDLFRFGNREV